MLAKEILTIPVNHGLTEVKRVIYEKPKRGIECFFIQLTKNKGIKIYNTKIEAKRSYDRQMLAYNHGIAPKVLSKVKKCYIGNLLIWDTGDIFSSNKDYGYCYITQIAKTPCKYTKKELEVLNNKFDEIGFDSFDLRSANVGRVGKKLVAIDFGDISTMI